MPKDAKNILRMLKHVTLVALEIRWKNSGWKRRRKKLESKNVWKKR